tara:strand:- start:7952 stop:8641 length:690 start_codon:yes stop_codon:yes gene_type:complete
MKARIHPADTAAAAIVAAAERFEIALFLGRGRYAKAGARDLEQARREAERLEGMHGNGKRALIYAISAEGRSAPVTQAILNAMECESMKTYTKKFNAQRAAKAAGLDPDETEIIQADGGFAWRRKEAPKPEPAAKPSAKTLNTPKTGRKIARYAALEEAAKNGKMPAAPDFSAPTHARFRGKLARLVELAEAGDMAGLEAVEINPISTSPKAMKRYRDLCVIALHARPG